MKEKKIIFLIKKVLLYVAIIFIFINIIAYLALFLKLNYSIKNHPKSTIYKNQNIKSEQYLSELNQLISTLEFDPYTGYKITKNIDLEYFKTDSNGYRIDGRSSKDEKKMSGWALYGGSTLFGVSNSIEGTIPIQLQQNCPYASKFNVLNFGVPGYSSQSELIIFIETLRLKKYKIKKASFYDGVNEVLRYAEKIQDQNDDELYDVFGYPFKDLYKISTTNFLNSFSGNFAFTLPVFEFRDRFIRKFSKSNNINYLNLSQDDFKRHVKNIVDIYEFNVNTIKYIAEKNNIDVDFYWQPTLFDTTNKSVADNNSVMLHQQPVIAELFRAVNAEIKQRKGLNDIVNLTGAFNELNNSDHFVDPVHVDSVANRIVADKICTSSRP
jgi:hypothetical protein